jgi:benzylsuccinate CoA-transferase BbsF subunit
MGLSFASLSPLNPGLIMVSTGILGRKGTMGIGMSGTGMTGAAYAGATNLVGWPDRPPTGPYGPWTDAVAPRFVVSSILAALHRRQGDGRGIYIDLSQAEAGLQFLTPAYLDYAVNGVVAQRSGSAESPLKAPCAAYPCLGMDRWLVIDADTPAAWEALRRVLAPALDDPAFSTLVRRLRSRGALNARITDWTRLQDPHDAEQSLQAAGVPAHVICDDYDLGFDLDLESAGVHRRVEDPTIGELWFPGPQYTLSATAHPPTRPGPRIGDSTAEILIGELGFTPAEVEALKAREVLG